MKQVLQNISDGQTVIVEAPAPSVSPGHVLIATSCSLISAGTERMLVDFGKASYLDKARQQPEKVKMVVDKIHTDGLMTTVDAVRSKLAQPLPLGYCNIGVVLETGSGVEGLKPGDRVVSNGPHADVVHVGKNLCAKVPDDVTDQNAVFTVLGAIGLEGLRLSQPTLGESFVVIGVGLIGLLTVQLLRLSGCRVLAIDFDDAKLALAAGFGAETYNAATGQDPVSAGQMFSRGKGVDGVIITASTKSSDPVTDAARMSRKRGRIILVGVTGLSLNRSDFYEKELTFQVSCSYGPGRYDPDYEVKGQDYPHAFVRWTEQRNFEAILDMMSEGRLHTGPLVSHNIEFEDAVSAYELLAKDRSVLGIILNYKSLPESRVRSSIAIPSNPMISPVEKTSADPVLGFIGAGNYASRILIPAFKEAGARLHAIASLGGVNSVLQGEKAGFSVATTDVNALIHDPLINTIVVVTRHGTHADYVEQVIAAGKNVFVEKPLAITHQQLDKVMSQYQNNLEDGLRPRLMVGFNRRFSPLIVKMKSLLDSIQTPKTFMMTMNAGAVPSDHWIQDAEVGGGRIIGEACHYIDLMRHLAGCKIVSVQSRRMGGEVSTNPLEDKAAIVLGFEDGSFGTIHYLANGHSSFPKERIEVFAAGRVLQLDNFRKLKGYGWSSFKHMRLWKQDKGQAACADAFLSSISKGIDTPISADEIFEVTRIALAVADQLREQTDAG